ncbi:MAG: hypothetical protein MPW15_18940 [Candidatus Manganitrophus sp.]|nr:hypothetical protein [Candidatus Manganitrophus sp.]
MAVIGKVTEDRLLTIKNRDQIVAQIPVSALTSEAPVYERPIATPKFQELVQSLNIESIQEPKSYSEALRTLLASPTLASKEWVYRQYDHMVQTNTVVGPGEGRCGGGPDQGDRSRPGDQRRWKQHLLSCSTRTMAGRSPWRKRRETWSASARNRSP